MANRAAPPPFVQRAFAAKHRANPEGGRTPLTLRTDDFLDKAAEWPGQFHWRFQHDENDARGRAVGDRPMTDRVVGNRDIALGIMTGRVAEPPL